MGALNDLRVRSNRFVQNLPIIIEGVIDDNKQLIELNQKQLKDEHATILDQPIRPPYSKNYATLKGFTTPDLYASGDMFESMTIASTKDGNYYIDSSVDYFADLVAKYKGAFGIAKSKQPEAQTITTKLLADEFKRAVLT